MRILVRVAVAGKVLGRGEQPGLFGRCDVRGASARAARSASSLNARVAMIGFSGFVFTSATGPNVM